MIRLELWGGQRDGDRVLIGDEESEDECPLEILISPLDPRSSDGIDSLVYELTQDLTNDGAIRYRFIRELLKDAGAGKENIRPDP